MWSRNSVLLPLLCEQFYLLSFSSERTMKLLQNNYIHLAVRIGQPRHRTSPFYPRLFQAWYSLIAKELIVNGLIFLWRGDQSFILKRWKGNRNVEEREMNWNDSWVGHLWFFYFTTSSTPLSCPSNIACFPPSQFSPALNFLFPCSFSLSLCLAPEASTDGPLLIAVQNFTVGFQWQPPAPQLRHGILTEYRVTIQRTQVLGVAISDEMNTRVIPIGLNNQDEPQRTMFYNLSAVSDYRVLIQACTVTDCHSGVNATFEITAEKGEFDEKIWESGSGCYGHLLAFCLTIMQHSF